MKQRNLLTLALASALASSAAAQVFTNNAALQAIEARARAEAQSKKEYAVFWAAVRGMPARQVLPNGKVMEIVEVRGNRPIYLETHNVNAAISTRANRVHPGGGAGFSLTGSGITLGIWDGGTVRTTHQEYVGRVTVMDGEALSGDHASHVAGTMIASGVNASAKGMSYDGMLHSYGWNSDTGEMTNAAANGLRVSNHSYGYITGWYNSGGTWYWFGDLNVSATEDPGFGFYDSTAAAWDNVAYNAPFYLICKSSGNDRNQGPTPGTGHYVTDPATGNWTFSTATRNLDGNGTGYDTISYAGVAKNILTVGATNDVLSYTGPGSVTMSSFSSWGPTDDGRIKPDISGNGVGLFSSIGSGNASYASFSGTSMSTPNVSGSLGLLVQHNRNLNSGNDMRSATLKGLVIHTADEAGANVGPDYVYGWGLMNTERAAVTISQDQTLTDTIREETLSAGSSNTFTVYSDGSGPLRVTICWTDPAGSVPAWSLNPTAPRLVNDLDLKVSGPSGTHMPYILDPANPSAAATTGDNFRDNVEQVLVSAPVAGTYTITVSHKGVGLQPVGQQAYSVITTGLSVQPSPAILTGMTLDGSDVDGGGSVIGTVTVSNTQGATINLSSNNSAATVPATVTVPSGQTSATFTVSTTAVATHTDATITASLGSDSFNQVLQVRGPTLATLSFSPSSVEGGSSSTGTVTVTGNVPSGGITIDLSSDNSAASLPSTVTIAQGQTSANFTINTTAVETSTTAMITASFNGESLDEGLTIQAAVISVSLAGVSLSPSTVYEGHGSTGTVTLTGPAPAGGAVVSIAETGGTSSLSLPANVTVPAGSTSATFAVGTGNIGASQVTRTVTATYDGGSQSATLTIQPITVTGLTLSPSAVKGGKSSTGTVTLNAPAGVGGAVVAITANTSNVGVPATVTVPQGATSVSFTITTVNIRRNYNAGITATRNGTSASAILLVRK